MDISGISSICMGCMKPLSKPGGFCTSCGWNNNINSNQPHQLPIFTILNGKYLVGRAIGQGGFGITYVGMDLYLDTKVAIKEYYPETCVTRESASGATVMPYAGEKGDYFTTQREKFVGEAKLLAKLADKPSIVHVRDFFRENGTAYIVMEYVEGTTLKEIIKRGGGRLQSAYVLNLLKPIMEDLALIHAQNLIHRDISPDNIMVQPNGMAKLLDFGAARETDYTKQKSMTVNVKHGFAPEEQYRTHGTQGPWTDIYAMCATIYHATTGVIPEQSVDRVHEDTLMPPNSIGADFTPAQERALMRGLALKAEERFRSFYDLMKEFYGDAPVTTVTTATSATTATTATSTTGATSAIVNDAATASSATVALDNDNKTVPLSQVGADEPSAPETEKKKKKTGLIIGLTAGGAAVIAAVILIMVLSGRSSGYSQALSLIASGDYEGAEAKLEALPEDYEDAKELALYAGAMGDLKAGEFDAAKRTFIDLGDYKDSALMAKECDYQKALSLMKDGQFTEAAAIFASLSGYEDSADKSLECNYKFGQSLISAGKFDEAKKVFKNLGSYSDSSAMITECDYLSGKALLNSKKYGEAYEVFKSIRTYKDSLDLARECIGYSLSASLNNADDFYKKFTTYENEFSGSGLDYAKTHQTDIYNIGCTYLSQLAFKKSAEVFSWVAEYEDAQDLCEVSAVCADTNEPKERVEALRDYAAHPSVNKALMSESLFEIFLLGAWNKGSDTVLEFEPKGNGYHLTYSKSYVKKPTEDNDYYNVYFNGTGIFYTCNTGDTNKLDWFQIAIVDGRHIKVYSFVSEKTYELVRK